MIPKWWFKIQRVIYNLIDDWIGNIVWGVSSGRDPGWWTRSAC